MINLKPVITELAGLSLSPDSPFRRDPPRRSHVLSDAFWNSYDSRGLIYTAIHDASVGRLSLFGPPALNLLPILSNADYVADGISLGRPRHRHVYKFDRLDFACSSKPDHLEVSIGGQTDKLAVHSVDEKFFAGSNLIYTMSRDNDLEWIRDWLKWYRKVHRADAILFADNGSSRYSLEEIAETLGSVEGYRRIAVIGVPFRHSPARGTVDRPSNGAFLQTGIMNAMRLQYMSAARAVLNVDVDELVAPLANDTVFDRADKALLGIVMLPGHWRHALPSENRSRHSEHYLVRSGEESCPPKYCVRPNSVAGRRIMKVHAVKSFRKMPFVRQVDCFFYHCRGISTSWKYSREVVVSGELNVDARAKSALSILD